MQIGLGTRNPTKVGQIKEIFRGSGIDIRSLDDLGIEGEGKEGEESLSVNAFIKAEYGRSRIQQYWIADDSGIFIDVLDGAPGVRSARWAGEKATDQEIMEFTLHMLEGKRGSERDATFRTVALLLSPDGERRWEFTGDVRGNILTHTKAKAQPHMPYGAIFVPKGANKPLSEMSHDELGKFSHRYKAFRKTRDHIVITRNFGETA